ncbi:putative NAD(P)H nitroreductase [Virgisporangium aliadipatigenens]|uniref:Putative NAD(P)H nitroreductase n=1 Tax=Virgisporangium aliadipatigenens TaxID=741659 RepID=A0A8J3YMA0_9ACTN|nr:nitroreductase family protein [Virgisporangium aliadipatigenens]GIJ48119.1 putative NAD(P)H nitroreductase [Virgisporangium aliadipatigenens]
MTPETVPTKVDDGRAALDTLTQATLVSLRAPSILNSQPWRWRVRNDDVELRVDPARRLHRVDPAGRLETLSCGIALHHALTGLAASGFAGHVTRLPAGEAPELVARLRLGPVMTPERTAYEAVYRRRTDRRPFADAPPAPDDLDALCAAARRHGVVLTFVTAAQVESFAQIVALAAAAEREIPAYARDVTEWSDRARSSGDGVALNDVPAPGRHRVPPRDFAQGRAPGLAAGDGTDGGTVYAVLATSGDERADWLAAGEALSDVWLTLTARGLAASPISEVVEVPQARAALRRLLAWTGVPAIAMRIGRPGTSEPPPRSARRSGSDVVGLPGEA